MDYHQIELNLKAYGTLFLLIVYWPVNMTLYFSGWQGVMKIAKNNVWINWFLVCYFGFFFLVYFQIKKIYLIWRST